MRYFYLLPLDVTEKLPAEDWENKYEKRDILYRRPDYLPESAIARRCLENIGYRDTISYELPVERSSHESVEVQKDPPALRLINREQEGHAITFQKWKGIVLSISRNSFVAQLTDMIDNVPEEQAEFFRSDIQDDDKELLSVGAVFYWCIGYVYSSSGQATRASFLRFQRLPPHSKDGIKLTSKKAKEINDGIIWR